MKTAIGARDWECRTVHTVSAVTDGHGKMFDGRTNVETQDELRPPRMTKLLKLASTSRGRDAVIDQEQRGFVNTNYYSLCTDHLLLLFFSPDPPSSELAVILPTVSPNTTPLTALPAPRLMPRSSFPSKFKLLPILSLLAFLNLS